MQAELDQAYAEMRAIKEAQEQQELCCHRNAESSRKKKENNDDDDKKALAKNISMIHEDLSRENSSLRELVDKLLRCSSICWDPPVDFRSASTSELATFFRPFAERQIKITADQRKLRSVADDLRRENAEWKDRTAAAEAEIARTESVLTCVVCMERRRVVASRPCMHLTHCETCDVGRECSICKAPVRGTVHVFLP